MGSPELLAAEVVLDATVLLGLSVDWLLVEKSAAEAVWLEVVLLCESVAAVDATETLPELESVV